MKPLTTLNLTPTWTATIREYLTVLDNLNATGRKQAHAEILHCAVLADNYVADALRCPNGRTSWNETYYEVVSAITVEMSKQTPTGVAMSWQMEQGHCGLYELAQELTDEFEKLNAGREWDGEFFDEVTKFLNEKLK